MRKSPSQPPRRRPETAPRSDMKVYSYYRSSRPEQRSPDKNTSTGAANGKKRQRRRFRLPVLRMAGRWLVVVILLVIIGVIMSVDTSPIIRLDADARPFRGVSSYRDGADGIIRRSLGNRFKPTFDYKQVQADIKAAYPEVEQASVSLDIFGRKPVVRLRLHQPSFIVVSKGEEWVVDDRGVAIARRSDPNVNAGTAVLPNVIDQLNIGGEVGKPLLTPNEANFIATIVAYLEADKLSYQTIVLPPVAGEVDIQLTGDAYRVKLNSEEAPAGQYGTWKSARETLAAKGAIPAEYIDVRAGEKVFWK